MFCGDPALMVGSGRTVTVIVDITAAQGLMPVVVKVSVAVPVYPATGVQVAVMLVKEENVPPALLDHVPPVAEPPTLPVIVAVCPLQMV